MSLDLLKDPKWLRNNEAALKDAFPETWTHTKNINFLQVRFRLKLIGLDFRDDNQVAKILTFLTTIGMLEVKPLGSEDAQIRRSSRSIFA